jgi:hypothetical protein
MLTGLQMPDRATFRGRSSSAQRRVRALAIIGSSVLAAGCSSGTDAAEPSWMQADLAGAVESSFNGSGEFSVDPPAPGYRLQDFVIDASDSTDVREFISIAGFGYGRPAVGDYPLQAVDGSNPEAVGVTAFVLRRRGLEAHSFATRSGLLRITRSTDDRIEGTFQFTGVEYVTTPPLPDEQPAPGTATLDVTGSFSVAKSDGEVRELIDIQPLPGH